VIATEHFEGHRVTIMAIDPRLDGAPAQTR